TATAELRSLTLAAAARSPPSVTAGSRSRIIPHRATITVAEAVAGRAAEELRIVPAGGVRPAAAPHTGATQTRVEEIPSSHPRGPLGTLLFRTTSGHRNSYCKFGLYRVATRYPVG